MQIANAAGSLVWFAAGVAAGPTSLIFAYLTHLYTANYAFSQEKLWDAPWMGLGDTTRRYELMRNGFHLFAFLAGAAALVFFVAGIVVIKSAIQHIATT